MNIGIFGSAVEVRDLWTHQLVTSQKSLHVDLRPHASALYRIKPSQ